MNNVDLGVISLGQIHVLVEDIDDASEFYRNIMGFVEMQSHNIKGNAGLSKYYGLDEEMYGEFNVQLRFITLPGVMTIKLISVENIKKPATSKPYESRIGIGPISIETSDLDATYKTLQNVARNYSNKWKIHIKSEPVYLSPLKPHEIGATENSALYGNDEILDELERAFPERAKFQMVDPFGVAWEFNNSML